MIYVLVAPYLKRPLLRISFVNDEDGVEKIKSDIREYNPSARILYLFEGGTREDLGDLHYYFRSFKLDLPGDWWFEYNQDIIDFFEVYETLEEVRKAVRR